MVAFVDPILDRIDCMQEVGYSGKEICEFFGMTPDELRKMVARRNSDNRRYLAGMARRMKDEGKSYEEIAGELGKKVNSIMILINENEPIDNDRPVMVKRKIGFV